MNNVVTTERLLAIVALVCVILSFALPNPILIPIAIIFVCLALII